MSRVTKLPAALAALVAICAIAVIAGCGGDDEPADVAADPFYGVAPEGLQSPSDYERMRSGGLGTVRVVLQWSGIETAKGVYNWQSSDQVLGALAVAGLDPLVTVYGTPPVYASDPNQAPTNDEETFDAWADFVGAAASRYGSQGDFWPLFTGANPGTDARPIREWEIWNEPNSSTFWSPTPDPAAYADLLKRSSKVIRKEDPAAEIMSAGMFATPQSDGAIVSYDFIESLYDISGVDDAIDIVGLHPYGPDEKAVVDQVETTRETIEGAGSDAPMWATEIGWGSNPRSGNDLSKTPEEQAELLGDTFGELNDSREDLGLEGVVWYTWHDSTESAVGECGWCATAGLVDADRDTKPSWTAYTDLTGGTP